MTTQILDIILEIGKMTDKLLSQSEEDLIKAQAVLESIERFNIIDKEII